MKLPEAEPDYYQDMLEIDDKLPPFIEGLTDLYVSNLTRFSDGDYEADDAILELSVAYLESTYAI
ncbi:hypothetical protein ACLI4U_12530 [Natrialbaceae archaeon A-CW2]